ncbi:MAG: YhcH/YjgK/YiaL family protein [Duncaniella sp.]|uniref:YhcH/YjgK/YiaL family protein n=1 Tax=Duncaniella sp. TaxID=2518496 RepID=UPI0023C639E2|nr:YhcH/YjgK/YiaL family protein [Duncaniella sp.]MDE6089578.1 YhcH/YjgK/YiaL family protein [Duncaniella sp.]
MSTEKVITPAEAREWVESREWANGWNVNADETVDAVEFATQYHRNKDLWDKLFKFLAEHDPMTLEPGKIEIEKGRVWINVPEEYTPKSIEDTRTENHRKFIDLQYTFVGDELYGLADPDKATPTMEYDPVKDRTFYRLDAPASYVPAGPDRFFLYFPKDLHQPSVRTSENPGSSRKLVGKIEYAE